MIEPIVDVLYDRFGIQVPQSLFANQPALLLLREEVSRLVPKTVFDNQFDDETGIVRRGGFPWEVRQSETAKGYELISHAEHYVVNFRNFDGVMVPEYALLRGGTVAVALQWDEFQGSPYIKLFDIAHAGLMPNKTRFERNDNNTGYFHPTRFGVNLGLPNDYKPPDNKTSLPYPRLVYDFQNDELQIQWGLQQDEIHIGSFSIGRGGEQILIDNRPQFSTIPYLHLNIDETEYEFFVSAMPADSTRGVQLRIPNTQEDIGYPSRINLNTLDNWVMNVAAIVVPQYTTEKTI